MIRYYAYIDVATIDSFYNQMRESFASKKINKSTDNEVSGEVKFSILRLITSFFTSEGTLKATRRKLSSEEIELVNSVENKIEALLSSAKGKENQRVNIADFNDDRKLIVGTAKVMEENFFIHMVRQIYNKKFSDYEHFFKEFKSKDKISKKWRDVSISERDINGVDMIRIMKGWHAEEEIISFIIVDNEYPILMDISNKKITMPHSDVRSSGIFTKMIEFCVLGITNKVNGVYTLKPLALWVDMDDKVCRDCIL